MNPAIESLFSRATRPTMFMPSKSSGARSRGLALLAFAALVAAFCPASAAPALAVCNASALFQQGVSLSVGSGANRAVLVDLNQDGFLDLVVTTPGSDSVAVMRGIGDGTFTPRISFRVGDQPEGVAVADFDGDGIVDLAVTNWGSNTVSILHGSGSGTFSAPLNYYANPAPYGVIAVDVSQDGILDLVVANNSVAEISVMIGFGSGGVGNGAFSAPVSYPIAGLGIAVASGDFNGDGKVDLVATANFNGISVLLGNGNGTFQPSVSYASGAQATFIVVRNFDADNIQDLAVSNTNFGGLAILKGAGNGTFGAPTMYLNGLNLVAIAAGDFNADGIADLACTNVSGDRVEVMAGQGSGGIGNGNFAFHSNYSAPAFPLGISTADLNGDGFLDLAVAEYNSNNVRVLLGACITPPPPPPPPGPPHLVSVRDVPNDQGGRVFLRWTRSSFDSAGQITGYRVWRRIPPGSAAAARVMRAQASSVARVATILRRGGASATDIDYWEAIATLPAEGLAGYGYTAATTQDSLPQGNPYTAFFVTALTSNPATFYESNVDSGYSVDNFAPVAPAPFLGVYSAGATHLHWQGNSESDLAGYRIYRGNSAGFVPSSSNLIAAEPDTGYSDVGPAGSYYKLSAVDIHGNESSFTLLSPSSTTDVGGIALPRLLAFAAPRPNPATQRTVLSFALPQAGLVTVAVYDMEGRRVRMVSSGRMDAGEHQLTFDLRDGQGRQIPSGLYFIRLEANGQRLVRRLAIVK